MIYCFNFISWESWICTWMFIGHLSFFIKLLVCVHVPFSFPVFMIVFLTVFQNLFIYLDEYSFILYTNLLLSQVIFLSIFFHHGFEKFKFCYMEDVTFKLCNKIYPSFTFEVRNLVFLCASKDFLSHKISKFVFIFSFTHFMTPFFAILMHMSRSITAWSLMIGTSRYSVNISCYSVLCSVCSEMVIHGM